MPFNFLMKQPVMGVAIQPNSIQLIELKRDIKVALLHYGISDLNNENTAAEHYLLDEKIIVNTLSKLLTKSNVTTRNVAIYLPHYLLKEDVIIVPKGLKTDEIRQEINARIKATYPTLNESIHFDYHRELNATKKQERIQFIFAKMKHIQQLINIILKAKLVIKIIDSENHALIRTWRYLFSETNQLHQCQGLLSLSAQKAILLLFKADRLIASEEVEWHGDLTQLQQFILFVSHANKHTHLRLLLTGDPKTVTHVLHNTTHFQTVDFCLTPLPPLLHTNMRDIQQASFFIAFGLALRKLRHA